MLNACNITYQGAPWCDGIVRNAYMFSSWPKEVQLNTLHFFLLLCTTQGFDVGSRG